MILTRLVEEAADQKRLATVMIFLVAVARELLQQVWWRWLEPSSIVLIGTLVAPAVVSLLLYAVLSAFEHQQRIVRAQQEQLQQASLDRLALDTVLHLSATVQHEINNPLMIIAGHVDLSLQQDSENPRLKGIKEAVQRIREVTVQLAQIKAVRLMSDSRQRLMVDLDASVEDHPALPAGELRDSEHA